MKQRRAELDATEGKARLAAAQAKAARAEAGMASVSQAAVAAAPTPSGDSNDSDSDSDDAKTADISKFRNRVKAVAAAALQGQVEQAAAELDDVKHRQLVAQRRQAQVSSITLFSRSCYRELPPNVWRIILRLLHECLTWAGVWQEEERERRRQSKELQQLVVALAGCFALPEHIGSKHSSGLVAPPAEQENGMTGDVSAAPLVDGWAIGRWWRQFERERPGQGQLSALEFVRVRGQLIGHARNNM